MKHLIMGTAGHVDHGKTALIKALTGTECDTHKEEKLRGITINLGFASLKLPTEDIIGIVDVPGHRDFIHTMVAGASGIDIALMVIAADSGIMPQTREHLQIMQILGIRSGIIAISRIDLVDTDIADMACEEARELVEGTFLDNCPIVKVSSRTGDGMAELKDAIVQVSGEIEQRQAGEVFRMYIDRIFSISGFGTVVTGSVLGGSAKTASTLYLLPAGKELKVRRIEHHGQEVQEITAGDRASMNLTGLSKADFSRGMMIADRILRTTVLLDARLELFDHERALELWSHALFFMGTFEAQVRIHLLDKDILRGGDNALVQIHLPELCLAQSGDHFVIRSTSGDFTLGGGEIIDPSPLHHRRRPEKLIITLSRISDGKLGELIASEVKKHPGGISVTELAELLNTSNEDITVTQISSEIRVVSSEKETFYIGSGDYDLFIRRITGNVSAYHRANPLEDGGRTLDELHGSLFGEGRQGTRAMLQLILEMMERGGELKKVRHTWAMVSHNVDAAAGYEAQIRTIELFLEKCGVKTPLISELEQFAKENGVDEKLLKGILRYLVSRRRTYQTGANYIHASVVDQSRERLLRELLVVPDGLTVARFRDLINGNRKLCLLLLSIYDEEGVTERKGDMRIITEKGRVALESTERRRD